MNINIKNTVFGFLVGFIFGTMTVTIYSNIEQVQKLNTEIQSNDAKLRSSKKEINDLISENKDLKQTNQNLTYILNNEVKNNSRLSVGETLTLSDKDRDCLLKNVFYEAGIEPLLGKLAVAQVTINRLMNGRWGKTICKVVHARKQFSWTLRKKHTEPDGELWEETKLAVSLFERGVRVNKIDDSLYYHATWIDDPAWVDDDHKIAQIGSHVFYKDSKKK